MKKQLLLISLILISISLLSQNKYFSVNLNIKQDNSNIMPIRVLQDNGTNGIVIEYNFPGISSSNVFASEGQYQFIHIGGFGKMHEVGKPGLPAHSDFVAVPNNATAFLRVIDVEYVKFENFNIHPALKPATDTYGDPEPEFEIDSVLYNTNAFYPKNNIEIAEILNYRGNTFVRVRLCPVQHNPVSGKIRVISKITYEVYFSTSPSFFEDKTLSENLLNIFPNFILNATSVKQEIEQNLINNESKAKSDDRSDIILITNSEFDEAASALALWRRQLGYSVEIVSQPEWTSQEVEEAIHSRYAIWNPAPEFFVIIGDHEDVPGVVLLAPDDNEYASDLYYACMDGAGDYIPDMAHGRISVSDNEEAVRVVEKIIQYEKNPVDDLSFYQNGLNCAMFQDDENNGYASRRFTHTCENIRDYVILQGYNSNRVYSSESNISPTNYNPGYYSNGEAIPEELLRSNGFEWNGSTQDIINNIDEGKFYVFHRDHGYSGGSGWASPYFTTSSMSNLNNGNKLPVVFSINCHTGEFKLNECFAERFLRLENGGAVGVFAAAFYSYSGYNDGISLGFIDAIWSNPGIIPVFGEGGIPNPNLTSHSDITTMGNVLNQGLIRMMETWDGSNGGNRYTHELFHYFGDPAMKLFTMFPMQITAENTDTIFLEETTVIDISNCSIEDGLATLVINNELISSTYLENGLGQLEYNNELADFAILTISKHNYSPYIDTIFVAGVPIPEFSVFPTITCDGDVYFYDRSIINPTSWFWQFGDVGTSNDRNPIYNYEQSGVYDVTLVVTNSFGTNSITKSNLVTIDRPDSPETISGIGCENNSVTLSATGDGELFWYESLISNEIINEGESFSTPELDETTTYYVENVLAETVITGKTDTIGESSYKSVSGLVFDVYVPLKLIAVTVYTKEEGEREIVLFDSYFNEITSTLIYLEEGENRLELNYNIPEGEGYKLFGFTDCELLYNTSNLSFPYEIDNVMSITGSSFIPDPTSKYFFFYNWEVEALICKSTRVDVTAEIRQPVVSDFQYEQNNSVVTYNNTSINANLYFWDFGDGSTSEEENPTHNYTAIGNYVTTLIAENECSSDTSFIEIIYPNSVNEIEGLYGITIFPNPADKEVTINFNATEVINLEIQLSDISGYNILLEKKIVKLGKNTLKLQIQDINPGVYIVQFRSETGNLFQKLIIK